MAFDPRQYVGAEPSFNPAQYAGSMRPDITIPGRVKQEAAPQVSWWNRFVAQNFANDDKAAIKYLKQEYPGLQIEKKGRNIAIKSPEETEWKVLDPDTIELSDFTDVLAPIASGVAQTAAAAGGAFAGGAAGALTGPAAPVAIPAGAALGAATAGSAAAVGAEGIRQSIGQLAGIPQEYSTEKMKEESIYGAAAPLLFGAGTAAKPLVKGAVPYVASSIKKGLTKTFGTFAGVPEERIKAIMKPEVYRELVKTAKLGPEKATHEVMGGLKNPIKERKSELNKELNEILGEMPEGSVPIEEVRLPFQELINKRYLQWKKTNSEADKRIYEEVAKSYADNFPQGKNLIDGTTAFDLKKKLDNLAEFQRGKGGDTAGKEYGADKFITSTAVDAVDRLKSAMDKISQGKFQTNLDNQTELRKIEANLKPFFSTPQKTYNTIRTLDTPGKIMLGNDITKLASIGVDVKKPIEKLQVYETFAKPSELPLSYAGTTSTSRTGTGAGLLGGLGGFVGRMWGGTAGLLTGTAIGSNLGTLGFSPANIRRAAAVKSAVARGAEMLEPYTPESLQYIPRAAVPTSAWEVMR